jgi:hypothetical protein
MVCSFSVLPLNAGILGILSTAEGCELSPAKGRSTARSPPDVRRSTRSPLP